MSMYDTEAEKVLEQWAASKYAVFSHYSGAASNKFFGGIDYHFGGKISDQWKEDGWEVSANSSGSYRSRTAWEYGWLAVKTKLPDWSYVPKECHFGFEGTRHYAFGMADFHYKNEDLYVNVGGQRVNRQTVTGALPSDHDTAYHTYGVKVSKNMAEFFIDGEVIAVAINSTGLNFPDISYPPYMIVRSPAPFSPRLPVLFEFWNDADEPLTVDMPRGDFGMAHGDPIPPRTYRLHDFEADTLLTSGTYDTGTSYKSHPIPVHGYNAKALLFRADTDSASDGLAVEVLTQEGNWRTYLTRTYSANSLESIEPTGEFPLMRLAYEPASDGASITDAEATVR